MRPCFEPAHSRGADPAGRSREPVLDERAGGGGRGRDARARRAEHASGEAPEGERHRNRAAQEKCRSPSHVEPRADATAWPGVTGSAPRFIQPSFLFVAKSVCFAAPPGAVRYVPRVEWDQSVVWITTRTIRPGTYDEFRTAWRPRDFPEGMVRAYECFSVERNEVVGISVWDSSESRERYRLSDVEAERQRAMAPFVEAESSGLYVGRELRIP